MYILAYSDAYTSLYLMKMFTVISILHIYSEYNQQEQ